MTVDAAALHWAEEQLQCCRLCPRDCRVNRSAAERGFCGCDDRARIFLEYVGYGEEPELTPSHTVFLSGCSLRCACCHTAEDAASLEHVVLTPALLRDIVVRGQHEGAVNLNLLGGEPSVSLPALLQVFAKLDTPLPPLVWNTSMYCSHECLQRTTDWVHIYAADFKVWTETCSRTILGVPDYPESARQRFRDLAAWAPGRILVRHLVMPGHLDCCTRPILRWLAATLPGARVSLQDYLPMPAARKVEGLGRFLEPAEFQSAVDAALSLGLTVIERLPIPERQRPASALEAQLAQGRHPFVSAQPVTVEVVLSPAGRVYLKHPNRASTMAAATALGLDETLNGGYS